jgi:hypothetical protein
MSLAQECEKEISETLLTKSRAVIATDLKMSL